MHALGARRIVHIAFHDRGIIGSLSFTLGYQKVLEEKIDNLLRRAHGQSGMEAWPMNACKPSQASLANPSCRGNWHASSLTAFQS